MLTENTQLLRAFKAVNLRGLSIRYAAPEVLKRFRLEVDGTQRQVFAGDVYSFGVVLLALMSKGAVWETLLE